MQRMLREKTEAKKKGEPPSDAQSELTLSPGLGSMSAAALLVTLVGSSMGSAISIARWIEERASEYRNGKRDPMRIDPKIASSPSVQRALRAASARYFF